MRKDESAKEDAAGNHPATVFTLSHISTGNTTLTFRSLLTAATAQIVLKHLSHIPALLFIIKKKSEIVVWLAVQIGSTVISFFIVAYL